jgi:hypothetical protein
MMMNQSKFELKERASSTPGVVSFHLELTPSERIDRFHRFRHIFAFSIIIPIAFFEAHLLLGVCVSLLVVLSWGFFVYRGFDTRKILDINQSARTLTYFFDNPHEPDGQAFSFDQLRGIVLENPKSSSSVLRIDRGIGAALEINQGLSEHLVPSANRISTLLGFPVQPCSRYQEFTVDGVYVEVLQIDNSEDRYGNPDFIRARFRFTPPGVLHVASEGVQGPSLVTGAPRIHLDDSEFDHEYRIYGFPDWWVKQSLPPELRSGFRRISQVLANGAGKKGVSLDAGPIGFSVTGYANLYGDHPRIISFLKEAIALFRHIRAQAAEGVRIISAEDCALQGDCPVCGQRLSEPLVRCDRCSTPHHQECWKYFGGCSIYACLRRDRSA